jgi:FAD:protein FMN transferase
MLTGALMVCLLGQTAISQAQDAERFQFREPHLGTIVELTLYAPNETAANDSAQAAFARIEELNRILSDYHPDSEAMRLCRTAGTGQAVVVSRELFEVLAKSNEISRLSDGAFDASVGPLVKLWRSARRLKKLPADDQLAAARQLLGWKDIWLDTQARSVELQKPGMLLDFGGIAKGYIADQARAVLVQRGIKQCLVAVAGDISAGDAPPGRDGWRIGIAPLDKPDGQPSRYLRLSNCSISTSGDAFQFVEIGGVRYSHIVDPATGLGLTRRSSVTVVAADGATADGLATALSVLGPDRGLKLIEEMKGPAALFVLATDDGISVTKSSEFDSHVIEDK